MPGARPRKYATDENMNATATDAFDVTYENVLSKPDAKYK